MTAEELKQENTRLNNDLSHLNNRFKEVEEEKETMSEVNLKTLDEMEELEEENLKVKGSCIMLYCS